MVVSMFYTSASLQPGAKVVCKKEMDDDGYIRPFVEVDGKYLDFIDYTRAQNGCQTNGAWTRIGQRRLIALPDSWEATVIGVKEWGDSRRAIYLEFNEKVELRRTRNMK